MTIRHIRFVRVGGKRELKLMAGGGTGMGKDYNDGDVAYIEGEINS